MKECDRVRLYIHPENVEKPIRTADGYGNLVMMAPFEGSSPLKAAPDLHEMLKNDVSAGAESHSYQRVSHWSDGPLVRWLVVRDNGVVEAHWVANYDVVLQGDIPEPTGPDPDAIGDQGIDVKAIDETVNGSQAQDRKLTVQIPEAVYNAYEDLFHELKKNHRWLKRVGYAPLVIQYGLDREKIVAALEAGDDCP